MSRLSIHCGSSTRFCAVATPLLADRACTSGRYTPIQQRSTAPSGLSFSRSWKASEAHERRRTSVALRSSRPKAPPGRGQLFNARRLARHFSNVTSCEPASLLRAAGAAARMAIQPAPEPPPGGSYRANQFCEGAAGNRIGSTFIPAASNSATRPLGPGR